jgi:hypothetical protein
VRNGFGLPGLGSEALQLVRWTSSIARGIVSIQTNLEAVVNYVVLHVTIEEKVIGTGSRNLGELEDAINKQAAKGFRLHTISTEFKLFFKSPVFRKQATLVFESI